MIEKEYYAALIKPHKYKEFIEQMNGMYCVYPPKRAGKTEYARSIETIYNLPAEICSIIDEDIKLVTKEEYDEIKKIELQQYEEFMRNYEPDYMWRKNE